MKNYSTMLSLFLLGILAGCNAGNATNDQSNKQLTRQTSVVIESNTNTKPILQESITESVIYDEDTFKKNIGPAILAADANDPGVIVAPETGLLSIFTYLCQVQQPCWINPPLPSVDDSGYTGYVWQILTRVNNKHMPFPFYGRDPDYSSGVEVLDMDLMNGDVKQPSYAISNDDMQFESTSVFVGNSTLTNDTDFPQTLSSSIFSKAISLTQSTTTTKGWKIGSSVQTTGSVDIVFAKAEIQVTVSTEYNSSVSDMVSKTTTDTFTAPAQNIVVPAHSLAVVTASLMLGKATGTYNTYQPLNSDGIIGLFYTLNGGPKIPFFYVNLRKAYDLAPESFNNMMVKDKQIYLQGSGTYTASAASNFIIKVEFVPNTKTPQNLLQASSYPTLTYYVKAEKNN